MCQSYFGLRRKFLSLPDWPKWCGFFLLPLFRPSRSVRLFRCLLFPLHRGPVELESRLGECWVGRALQLLVQQRITHFSRLPYLQSLYKGEGELYKGLSNGAGTKLRVWRKDGVCIWAAVVSQVVWIIDGRLTCTE